MALYHAYSEVENSNTGVPMAGVQVVPVFPNTGEPGVGVAAPIYADESETPFVPANTCLTDETGMYSFYIEPGSYNLDFFIGSRFIRRIEDVQFINPIPTNVEEPYRATLSEALNEFPIGFYFRSDDKNAEGPHPNEMWIYQRIGLDPGYVALVSNTASMQELNEAIAEAEAAATEAQNYGNATLRSDYTAADAETWTAGAWVQILSTDTGTHTPKAGDYNPGGGNTPNAGLFQEDATLGLIRRGANEGQIARDAADDALAAAGEAVDAKDAIAAQQIIGRKTGTTASASSVGNGIYVLNDPLTASGEPFLLTLRANVAGPVEISFWNKASDIFSTTDADKITLMAATGLNTFNVAGHYKAASGRYVGIYGPGIVAITSGTAVDNVGYFDSAGTYTNSFTDASASTANRIEASITVSEIPSGQYLKNKFDAVDVSLAPLAPLPAEVTTLKGIVTGSAGGAESVIGRPSGADLVTGTAIGGSTYVYGSALVANGFLEKVEVFSAASGNIIIKRFSKSGDDFTQVGSDLVIPVLAGLNVITYETFGPWPVLAGERLGYYGPSRMTFLSATGDSGGYYNSASGNFATFTDAGATTNAQFQLRLTTITTLPQEGLVNEVADHEGRIDALESGTGGDDYSGVIPSGYIIAWMIGQSNTDGRAVTMSPETFETGQAYKYVRTGASLQLLADPTGNTASSAGSLGPSFAKAVQRLSKGKLGVIVVNSAVGGTSLLTNWASGASVYNAAVADLAGALADAAVKKLPVVGACTYMEQGETDGDNAVTGAAYKAAFLDLKTRVDGVIGSKVPFLMTRIGTKNSGDTAAYATIRQAQDELAEEQPNVFMVHTGTRYFAERGLMMDTFHYVIAGYQEIGEATGNAAWNVAIGQRPKGYHG